MSTPEHSSWQLSVSSALQKMLSTTDVLQETERVEISAAVSRVLAQDLDSTIDTPPYDQAAVDGIAFRYADLASGNPFTLLPTPTASKGAKLPVCQTGECVFVTMGAPLPPGCDTVQLQAQVEETDAGLHFGQSIQKGQYVRFKGEEISANTPLMTKGKRLSVTDIGLLSSAGVLQVRIQRKVRVVLLSIGDDLRVLGTDLNKVQRFDTSRYMLSALLASSQAELSTLRPFRTIMPRSRSWCKKRL